MAPPAGPGLLDMPEAILEDIICRLPTHQWWEGPRVLQARRLRGSWQQPVDQRAGPLGRAWGLPQVCPALRALLQHPGRPWAALELTSTCPNVGYGPGFELNAGFDATLGRLRTNGAHSTALLFSHREPVRSSRQLRKGRRIAEEALGRVVAALPRLRVLRTAHMPLAGPALPALARHPALQEAGLLLHNAIPPSTLEAFGALASPRLQSLHLIAHKWVTGDKVHTELFEALAALAQIPELKLRVGTHTSLYSHTGVPYRHWDARALGDLHCLRALRLDLSCTHLECLAGLRQLHTLKVVVAGWGSLSGLSHVPSLPSLQCFEVTTASQAAPARGDLAFLSRCPLTKLAFDVRGGRGERPPVTWCEADAQGAVAGEGIALPKLRALVLLDCAVLEGCIAWQALTGLDSLTIASRFPLAVSRLPALPRLSDLQHLHVSEWVGESVPAQLAQATGLRSLALRTTTAGLEAQATIDAVHALHRARLQRLQVLLDVFSKYELFMYESKEAAQQRHDRVAACMMRLPEGLVASVRVRCGKRLLKLPGRAPEVAQEEGLPGAYHV